MSQTPACSSPMGEACPRLLSASSASPLVSPPHHLFPPLPRMVAPSLTLLRAYGELKPSGARLLMEAAAQAGVDEAPRVLCAAVESLQQDVLPLPWAFRWGKVWVWVGWGQQGARPCALPMRPPPAEASLRPGTLQAALAAPRQPALHLVSPPPKPARTCLLASAPTLCAAAMRLITCPGSCTRRPSQDGASTPSTKPP